MEVIKIPAQRVQVLRGDGDQTLELLRTKMKTQIDVDDDGTVELEGEPIDEYFGKGVIKAIGRGFEPHVALKLLQDEYGLNVVDLRDYARPEQMARIKGRIIGEEGKARMIIEKEAEVDLAIYGHTVGIIGKLETLDIATTAVFKIIEGQPHSAVYFYLEKNRRRREEGDMKSRAGGMSKRR